MWSLRPGTGGVSVHRPLRHLRPAALSNFITPCHIGIYLLYQLLICAVLILIPSILGGTVGALLRSPLAATLMAEACFVLLFCLLLCGPANPSNANDNSSGVLTVLDLMASIPEAQRARVCFVLFDLEEAGLWGSASYRKAHRKASQTQLVLNFDCVGDGDHLLFFPKAGVKRNRALLERLKAAAGRAGEKALVVWEGGSFYPSDQAQFPLASAWPPCADPEAASIIWAEFTPSGIQF